MSRSYDALLIVSFGGPEGPNDVVPFLENVLRGRNVPRQRLLEVAEHYQHFGGISPINQQNRDLIRALRPHIELPVYWGNRNWHPLLPDTIRQMAEDGIERALAFVTSPYSSYSGCRQYLENLAAACAEVGPRAPVIEKLRNFWNHPGFLEAMADRTRQALATLPEARNRLLLFTAHSIPCGMADTCDYVAELSEASRLVAETAAEGLPWQLVYQSRSGPPHQAWLEPDIGDHLETLAAEDDPPQVLLVPIGFISDHMEVLYDLDVEAREVAERVGISLARAGTVGTHSRFVRMIGELVDERSGDPEGDRPVLGTRGPCPDVCPPDCCPLPARK